MLKGNAAVGQSGGPTSAINATLAGVFKGASQNDAIDKIYGAVHGIEGIINDNLTDLSEQIKTDEDLKLLKSTPAAFLGSCRKKLPPFDEGKDVYEKIFSIFTKYNIKYFFYIGGNDSMDTVYKLSEYAKIINYEICIVGVPKTIDNDLALTDHTPGFGSAAKYIATVTKELGREIVAYDMHSVIIVEIMGRNAGWLTAASALAKDEETDVPDLIYLPEVVFDTQKFIQKVKEIGERKKGIIIAVSEGVKTSDGNYLCDSVASGVADTFGHKYLGGAATVLEGIVRNEIGYKARAVVLNMPQRCAAHFASKTDIDESVQIGMAAVNEAVSGGTGEMMMFRRISNNPYKTEIIPAQISKIANEEKVIPREWINSDGDYVTPELIEYMRPLIMGENEIVTENGLPKHIVLKK